MSDMIIMEIFAICIAAFMGNGCPIVDGEPQYWNENEIWTIYYFPHMTAFLSPQVGPGFFAGTYNYDRQGAFQMPSVTMVIAGAKCVDNLGQSVLLHELRHAMTRNNWVGHLDKNEC